MPSQQIIGQEPERAVDFPAPSSKTKRKVITFTGELLLALALVASLATACALRSQKKELWVDEAYSLAILTDPGLLHSMHALRQATDGGMPLYYIVGRLWVKLYGSSLLSLRLFTSLAICLGLLILWRTLSRLQSKVAALVSVLGAAGTSAVLLNQNAEVRFYGVYFASAAAVLASHKRLLQRDIPGKIVALAVVAHCLLIASHPFGILYSGVAIFALVIADYLCRALRPSLYLKLCASWLTLLLLLPQMLNVADLGRPHNWVRLQSTEDMVYFLSPAAMAICILVAVLVAALKTRRERPESAARAEEWSGLLVHAVGYLLVPIVIACISWEGNPMFVDRYFLPSTLGAAVVLAYIVHYMQADDDSAMVQRIVFSVLLVILLAWPIRDARAFPQQHYFANLENSATWQLPVVIEDANTFLPLLYYSRGNGPFYYVMDWDSELHSTSLHGTLQYKLMRNARSVGYYQNHIVDTRDVLCRFPGFAVFDSPGLGWFEQRVEADPHFVVQRLMTMANDEPGPTQVWIVAKQSQPPGCPN